MVSNNGVSKNTNKEISMKFDSIMEKVKDFGAAVLTACGPIALETAIAELQKLAGVKKPDELKSQKLSHVLAGVKLEPVVADEKPLPELPGQTEPVAPVKSKLTIEDLQARVVAGEGDIEGEDAKVRKSRKDAASSAKRMLAKLGAEIAAPKAAEVPVKVIKKAAAPATPPVAPPAAPSKAGKFGKAAAPAEAPAKFINGLKVGQVIIITDPADEMQVKLKITEVQAANNIVVGIAASDENGAPSLDSDDFVTLAKDPGPQPIEVLADGSNVELLTPKGAAVSKAAKKS